MWSSPSSPSAMRLLPSTRSDVLLSRHVLQTVGPGPAPGLLLLHCCLAGPILEGAAVDLGAELHITPVTQHWLILPPPNARTHRTLFTPPLVLLGLAPAPATAHSWHSAWTCLLAQELDTSVRFSFPFPFRCSLFLEHTPCRELRFEGQMVWDRVPGLSLTWLFNLSAPCFPSSMQ